MAARSSARRKTTTVADLGEMELVERIARHVSRAAQAAPEHRGGAAPEHRGRAAPKRRGGVVLGIGDDAALLRPRAGEDIAVSTDTAVEGVHFDWRVDDASAVGRRALAAAVSDLAAMGARPLGCTLALAVEPQLELRRLETSLRAFADEAAKRGCTLAGGNLSRASETSFAVNVVGAVPRGRALLRDGAQVGDGLFVTGTLGGAALARATAAGTGGCSAKPSAASSALRASKALNRFVPPDRLAAGRALARLPGLRRRPACIDLSDGLAADLPHLLGAGVPRRAEPLGADVDLDALPRPRGFEQRCARAGLDPVEALVAGGEDYELLFTLGGSWASEERQGRLEARLGAPVVRIGRISEVPGIRGLPARYSGYRHF